MFSVVNMYDSYKLFVVKHFSCLLSHSECFPHSYLSTMEKYDELLCYTKVSSTRKVAGSINTQPICHIFFTKKYNEVKNKVL